MKSEKLSFSQKVKKELSKNQDVPKHCAAAERAAVIRFSGNVGGSPLETPVFNKDCCVRAYLRGVFLCCGTVTEPEKSNQLEFFFNSESDCEAVCNMITGLGLGLTPKISPRKEHFRIYFKEKNQICDLLSAIGASSAMMEYENTLIVKELNSAINRKVNFANANMDKTIEAAVEQIREISLIYEKKGAEYLPASLRQLADERLKNPEISLTELGAKLTPPIGKSGVSHRLKKISKIAEELYK